MNVPSSLPVIDIERRFDEAVRTGGPSVPIIGDAIRLSTDDEQGARTGDCARALDI